MDTKNAFNLIRRDVLLNRVVQVLPEYFSYISRSYRDPSILFCGEQTIQSSNGVQQGDPLGLLLFCLVVDSLSKSLSSELKLWYLDDATIGGPPDAVMDDFATVMESATN